MSYHGYTKEDRQKIAEEINNKTLTLKEAAAKYDISPLTARDYLYQYRKENNIKSTSPLKGFFKETGERISDYENMSKAELINELIKAKVNEARAKKGYQVKGDGPNKEYSSLNNKNSKSCWSYLLYFL